MKNMKAIKTGLENQNAWHKNLLFTQENIRYVIRQYTYSEQKE